MLITMISKWVINFIMILLVVWSLYVLHNIDSSIVEKGIAVIVLLNTIDVIYGKKTRYSRI